jgi:signal transduction histidine kinase
MRRILKNLTLKWKIFAFLLGFCAILLVFLWIFQTVLLDSFYRAVKVMEIKAGAGSIVSNIGSESLDELLSAVSQNSEVSIDIVSESGADLVMSSGSNNFQKMPLQEKQDYIASAKAGGGDYIKYRTDMSPHQDKNGSSGRAPGGNFPPIQSIVYVRLVTTPSGDTAAILMDSQISPVNATVTTLRYQLYMITGVMLLLSVALALLIARRVSKPIVDISKSAKELAAGNYDIKFSGKGFREIGELSGTLNTAASELSKVEGLRRELMANISHDLRTPLALIYSYAEVMHDFPNEITPHQTQVIMDETQRLSSLVSDILDITKLESGIREAHIAEYDLTYSIGETTRRVAELVKKDGYVLSFSHEGTAVVEADETKITQVYYNLLINAVQYTGPDKTVAVRQTVSNGQVRIAVTDTGKGIAPEEQKYIWDRYYKIDKTHRRAVTGTGLGLSIVKKVMALHGGGCGVESSPGNGSTFWFSLKTRD